MFCCFGAPPAKAEAVPAPPILAFKAGAPANGSGGKEAVAESQRLDTAVHVDVGAGAVPVDTAKAQAVRPVELLGSSVSHGQQAVLPSADKNSQEQHSAEPAMRSLLAETNEFMGRQGSFAANSVPSTTRPGTDEAVLVASDSSGHRSGVRGLSLVPSLSPQELKSQVGELVFVGSGATGIVYRGTISSTTPIPAGPDAGYGTEGFMAILVPVAVKFMICNTPQQLWQRAKEALLSKLVTHPNLVRTLAMDVTLVTPNTYKEWGANNTSTTAAATARGHAHNGMGAGMASVATLSAAAPAAGAPAPAQAAGRASMDAPAFAAGALHGGGGGGGGSGSGSGSGSGVGSGAVGAGSGGSGNGRVFQSVACSPSHHHSFLAADATCGTTAGGTTVTSTTALMVSTANTLSASLGCCPISNTAVAAADGSVTVAAAAQHPNQRAASGAGAGGLSPVDVAASSAGSFGPGAGGGPAAVAGTAALQQWPGARDVLAPAGREASSDGARTVCGGTSVEVPTPQLPLSANGHSGRALSTVEASIPEGGSVRGPAAGAGAEVAVVGPDPAAGAPQAQASAARPLAPPPAINADFEGGSGGSGAAARGLLGLQGSVESSAAGLLPANALSPTGAPTQPPTPLPGPHGGGAPAGGAAALGNSGSGHCASAVSLLSPLMAPSGTATAACSPLPHTAPSRESSQRSLCPAMPSNGHVSIGAGAGSGMVAAVAAMHATSGVHAHAVAAGPGGGGGGVMRPGGPGSGGGDPVPFQDILYHLDAIPGRFLAKVIMEFCDGGTLLTRINAGDYVAHPDRGPLAGLAALRALLWCLQEVAAGMAHLHSLNIIHGDLKPGNVLLTSDESSPLGYQCKVSDFGLATALEASEQTITHENWGTVVYMAPESCAGRCRKASDVYSFGVLLWQMCTGQRPYAGLQAGQVLLGVKTGTLKLQWPPWANKSLVKVGQACMRFEPKERPGFKGIRSALAKVSARLDQKIAAVEAAGLGYDPSVGIALGLGMGVGQAGGMAEAESGTSPHPLTAATLAGEQGSGEHAGSGAQAVEPGAEAEEPSAVS